MKGTLLRKSCTKKQISYMKGGLEQETQTSLSVILFIIGTFIVVVSFVSTHNKFTAEVLTPALEKQTLADGTKIFESCIKENETITPELITKNADFCREKYGLAFVRIINVETGKEWLFGDQNKGKYNYKIFTKIKSEQGFESGILYAES